MSWAIATGAFLLVVGDIPGVSFSVFAPKLAVLLVLGAAGIPVLVLRALGAGVASTRRLVRPPAVAAVAFVAVAALSTALSPAVESAVVGVYQVGTGLVFVACLAGVWALGTCVSERGRQVLVSAIIAAAVVNAGVALAQQLVGLSAIPSDGRQATGLMGNPVFLGAMSVAVLALMAPRFVERPRRMLVPVVLVAAAVGMSGERLSAALLVVLAVGVVVAAFLGPQVDGGARQPRLRAAWFAATSIVFVVVGSLLPSAVTSGGGGGVLTRTAQSTVSNTVTGRTDVWRAGLSVLPHRLVLGFGPGQFRDAISTISSTRFASLNATSTFDDAHNIIVEYLTTTGVLGLLALVAWLVLAARRRRGALLVAAGLLLVVGLAQPLDVGTTPLIFLFLGAAPLATRHGWRGGRAEPGGDGSEAAGRAGGGTRPSSTPASGPGSLPGGRPGAVVSMACALLALVAGAALVVGDAQYGAAAASTASGQEETAVHQARNADRLLFLWPDPQVLVARSLLLEGATPSVANAAKAATAYRVAISRDPTDADLWSSLGMAELHAGRTAAALQAATRAVQLRPWDVNALDNLGLIDLQLGRRAQSKHWYGRSLQAEPNQEVTRALYEYGCVPTSIHAFLPAQFRCHAGS